MFSEPHNNLHVDANTFTAVLEAQDYQKQVSLLRWHEFRLRALLVQDAAEGAVV